MEEHEQIDWSVYSRGELEAAAEAMDSELDELYGFLERMQTSFHDLLFCQARVVPEDAVEFIDLDMVAEAERRNKIRQASVESRN